VRRKPSRAVRAVGAGTLGVAMLATGASPVAGATDHNARFIKLDAGMVRTDVLRGRTALVRGRVQPGVPGRTVVLQDRRRGRWQALDTARTAAGGAYTLRYRAAVPGAWRLRVVSRGDLIAPTAYRGVGRLRVYRPALASWYGPGLYGGRLACGGTLEPGTLGVASKTLPCGTKVTLRHGTHVVRVPVIDRGPYVAGREFDLTAATRARLHFGSTGVIWTTR